MDNKLQLDESEYKADFIISDKYIQFSSEILRLSLLAITGFGTLFMFEIKEKVPKSTLLKHPKFFIISICFFLIASSSALFHRYYATDSMTWYISWLRAKNNQNKEKVSYEKTGLLKMLRFSKISLIIAEVAFGIGVLFFFIAIIKYANIL